jgi:hypothetical protein
MGRTHPKLISPLKIGDKVLAELTQEKQAFSKVLSVTLLSRPPYG